MNKRRKLLSIILFTGIAGSTFPCSGTGATSDSIAFYNSKKTILDMRDYDEAYDTNHDGAVNVFDVIRENKEVFQEESYTDLKSQIHLLETQIEILTQKLNEKEDKAQTEADLSKINSELSGKVNQQEGKQLSSNDYTDEEKQKLENLNNYDDTLLKSDISGISASLSEKIDKEDGKQLSSNDYSNSDKEKLSSLNNYDDSQIKTEISELSSAISGKVEKQEGKQLSSNDYTDLEKEKLEKLENYDDTKINEKIDSLVQIAYEEKKDVETSIQSKVDKEEGKQLSSNDYTDEEKRKLESLDNYDDTELIKEINNIKSNFDNLSEHPTHEGITWNAVGDSLTASWFDLYVSYVADKTKMVARNYGVGGSCVAEVGSTDYPSFVSRICGTNGQTPIEDADFWSVFGGTNDAGNNVPIGNIDDTVENTFYGALNLICTNLSQRSNHPDIVLITPYWLKDSDSFPYVEAMIKIGEKYGIPVIDLYRTSGINSLNYSYYIRDAVHPNQSGADKLRPLLLKEISSVGIKEITPEMPH